MPPSLVDLEVLKGVNAADPDAQRLPHTLWDRALISFLQDPAILSTACWAGRRRPGSVAPLDRVDGAPYSTFLADPVIAENDTDFAFADDAGNLHGLPSWDFYGVGGLRSGTDRGTYSQSWTIACIVIPTNYAYGVGYGGIAYGIGSEDAAYLIVSDTWVTAGADRGEDLDDGAKVARAQLINDVPNVIVACGDHATREVALYVNSHTPVIASTVPPVAWPTLGGVGDWGFGNVGGNSFRGRAHSFAAMNKSAHHDPKAYYKLHRLIDAAAKTFDGLALV